MYLLFHILSVLFLWRTGLIHPDIFLSSSNKIALESQNKQQKSPLDLYDVYYHHYCVIINVLDWGCQPEALRTAGGGEDSRRW